MKNLVLLLVSVFSIRTYADSPEFLQLKGLYESGVRFDTKLIPDSGTIFLRGNCYFRNDVMTQPPKFETVVAVLHSRSFPDNGPVSGRRIIQGAVFSGLKTDQEAFDLFLLKDKASPGFGYFEPWFGLANLMGADLTISGGISFEFATVNTNGSLHFALLYRSRASLEAFSPLMACYLK